MSIAKSLNKLKKAEQKQKEAYDEYQKYKNNFEEKSKELVEKQKAEYSETTEKCKSMLMEFLNTIKDLGLSPMELINYNSVKGEGYTYNVTNNGRCLDFFPNILANVYLSDEIIYNEDKNEIYLANSSYEITHNRFPFDPTTFSYDLKKIIRGCEDFIQQEWKDIKDKLYSRIIDLNKTCKDYANVFITKLSDIEDKLYEINTEKNTTIESLHKDIIDKLDINIDAYNEYCKDKENSKISDFIKGETGNKFNKDAFSNLHKEDLQSEENYPNNFIEAIKKMQIGIEKFPELTDDISVYEQIYKDVLDKQKSDKIISTIKDKIIPEITELFNDMIEYQRYICDEKMDTMRKTSNAFDRVQEYFLDNEIRKKMRFDMDLDRGEVIGRESTGYSRIPDTIKFHYGMALNDEDIYDFCISECTFDNNGDLIISSPLLEKDCNEFISRCSDIDKYMNIMIKDIKTFTKLIREELEEQIQEDIDYVNKQTENYQDETKKYLSRDTYDDYDR